MEFARRRDAIPLVRSTAERAQFFPTPETNQRCYNLETGMFERYDGAEWVQDGTTFDLLETAGLTVTADASDLQDLTASQGTFSDRVLVNKDGHQLEISGVTNAGALVAGPWISGITEGINITPNNDGVSGAQVVFAYFDGNLYRLAFSYANTTGSAIGSLVYAVPLDISDVSAGQIKFPTVPNLSSDPNTLDYYHEVPWTPTLTPASGSITLSTAVGQATYKGRELTLTGKIVVGSVSTPTGNLTLGGFPTPSGNVDGCESSWSIGSFGWASTMTMGSVYGILAKNASSSTLQKLNGTGGAATLAQDVQAGTTLYLRITYFTA